MEKRMKCIVTGGAGFIGSHIVDRLINDGHEVIVIDNESSECNAEFYYNAYAKYYKYDIVDYDSIRPLFNGVDYVFHLAAESRIQPTIDNPVLAMKTNVVGTGVVLQCSREAEVKKVIYSSTSSAYGLANVSPLREDMIEDCLNPYSVSKVAGEKMTKMYDNLFGLKTVTFRYFNVYGPREPSKGTYAPVIGLFLRKKAAGEPLTIVGNGQQRRDFTHVFDVVEANILAMNGDVHGELINIGTGRNHSILELVAMIQGKLEYLPPRLGEARITLADNTKAKNLLHWEPKIEIEDYIKECLK
jgi:UDP-glucose 4-epimerase